MNVRAAWVITLLLFLASCATSNAPTSISLDETSNTGIVVFSLTSDKKREATYFQFQAKNNNTKGEVLTWSLHDPLDWKGPTYGRLVVLNLPVGEYEFYNVTKVLDYTLEEDLNLLFEAKRGEISYLGNIYFEPMSNFLSVRTNDEFKRDIPLFLERYPQFEDVEVKATLFDRL